MLMLPPPAAGLDQQTSWS